MIQRKQTLWLLLATIAAFLSFQFPFVTGKQVVTENTLPVDVDIDAASHMLILLLTVASIALSFIAIFMFKDRKLQLKMVIGGMVVAAGIVAVYIWQYTLILESTLALWCVLPFIVLASFIMAFKGIRDDEKLVKSLDKLR